MLYETYNLSCNTFPTITNNRGCYDDYSCRLPYNLKNPVASLDFGNVKNVELAEILMDDSANFSGFLFLQNTERNLVILKSCTNNKIILKAGQTVINQNGLYANCGNLTPDPITNNQLIRESCTENYYYNDPYCNDVYDPNDSVAKIVQSCKWRNIEIY